MKSDFIRVVLFVAAMVSGAAANLVFLRMWSKLDSIGQTPVSRISILGNGNDSEGIPAHQCSQFVADLTDGPDS